MQAPLGPATHCRCRLPALAALAWAACTAAWAGTLEGTATYRERSALPPDAVFEAVLQDVSRADAPAEVLGRARIDPAGLPPFNFRITFDDAAVQPGRRYVVRATIRHQGRLLFTTDRSHPVLRGGAHAPLDVLLVPAGSGRHPRVDSPLRGTYWKLVRLGEMAVQVTERQREPHLILADYETRISGSGGCNRVTGSFELDGDRLRLGRMASTRMACPDGMQQEQQFLQSLQKVERYRISGSHLELLDTGGALLARFEAVALR